MAPRGVISAVMVVTGGEIKVCMMVTIGLIEVFIMEDVDIGLKIPSTLLLSIWNKMFVVIGEMDIGPTPPILPSKTQVTIVY